MSYINKLVFIEENGKYFHIKKIKGRRSFRSRKYYIYENYIYMSYIYALAATQNLIQ